MQTLLREFRQTIERAGQELRRIPESEAETAPGEGAWSPKEILGHLVDSAANNHRRFVEAQLAEDLVFPGYNQEQWVALQQYQRSSWPGLIDLWQAYNLHLIHVVAAMPQEALTRPRQRHSLDRIAWQRLDREQPATLEYLVRDYVGHLKEHLDHILQASQPA